MYGMNESISVKDLMLQFRIISFTRSGIYTYYSGGIDNRSNIGNYWELGAGSVTDAKNLNFYSTGLFLQGNDPKGNGMSIRCLVR